MKIIDNLFIGMKLIHDQNLAHRDIKPGNLMINPKDLNVKFIDFGTACNRCSTTQLVGTPLYLAPELITNQYLSDRDISLHVSQQITLVKWMKTDLWALGACLVDLLIHQTLFDFVGIHKLKIPEDVTGLTPEQEDEALSAILRDIRDHGVEVDTIKEIVVAASTSKRPLSPKVQNTLIRIMTTLLQKDPEQRQGGLRPPSTPSL
jgi:serine/threonine protein kinase